MFLDATTKSIEVVLGGAVTANQLPITSHYVDVTTTANTAAESDTATNNTSTVTIVAAPSASTVRQVKRIAVYNADTAAATITVRLNNNSTLRILVKITLAVGDTLMYSDVEGWKVIDSSGQLKQTNATTIQSLGNPQQGFLINGRLSITVSSNNITVALKNLAGNDPSVSDPVFCRIQNTVRSVTSALSVTKNAGTNWFNSGSTELATNEIDYFVYLGYNATDGVVIGFSRIIGNQYSDFSTTTTNEKYAAISTITTAAATDYYELVGRFAATLSATAAFNWSVPTFTAINLIQRPIYETRILTSVASGTGFSSKTSDTITYQVVQGMVRIISIITAGTSNATTLTYTHPFNSTSGAKDLPMSRGLNNGTGTLVYKRVQTSSAVVDAYTSVTNTAWTSSGTKQVYLISGYSIAI